MINYIKSEIYRNLRNRGNYNFLLGCTAFVVFLNVVLYIFGTKEPNFQYNNTYFSFTSLYTNMNIPLILCLPLVSIIFGQEYKHHTLKNTISYGIPRRKIFFGKFIVMLIISLINLLFICSVYIVSASLLLENSGVYYLNVLLRSLIACMPLFLFSATVAHCLYFIFENEMTASILWFIIMIVIPKVMELLGARIKLLRQVSEMLPYNIIGNIEQGSEAGKFIFYWSSQQGLINCFIVGIVSTIIAYFIGMKLFEKVEIK